MNVQPCSVCSVQIAVNFCCCRGEETFLCPDCVRVHFEQQARNMHRVLNLQAYGQHKRPGYFDRRTARDDCLPSRIALLQHNLTQISECKDRLTQYVEQFLQSIRLEAQDVLQQLQAEQADLQAAIATAVQEVNETLDYDEVWDASPLVQWLRDPSIPQEALTLFSYRIEEIPSGYMRKIFTFDLTPYTFSPVFTILPAISANTLTLHNLVTHQAISTCTLTQSLPSGMMMCVVDRSRVLCIGGLTNQTLWLNIRTNALTVAMNMHSDRDFPGVIKAGSYVYVFGGNYPAITTSEKLVVAAEPKGWEDLPPMTLARRAFSPCLYHAEIYLIELCEFHGAEKFSLHSEVYSQLSLTLPSSLYNAVNFIAGTMSYS